jgi:hypothetical protein
VSSLFQKYFQKDLEGCDCDAATGVALVVVKLTSHEFNNLSVVAPKDSVSDLAI